MSTTPTAAITIRDIGKEAGVQFSLVTRHFGTKDKLLRIALEQIMTDWIAAMVDGPPDELTDRAIDHLARHPFDVAGIRLLSVDDSMFPNRRSPVVDAIVGYYDQAGSPVDAIDVIASLSLMLGWMSAESHWLDTTHMSARDARAIVKQHAKCCIEGDYRAT